MNESAASLGISGRELGCQSNPNHRSRDFPCDTMLQQLRTLPMHLLGEIDRDAEDLIAMAQKVLQDIGDQLRPQESQSVLDVRLAANVRCLGACLLKYPVLRAASVAQRFGGCTRAPREAKEGFTFVGIVGNQLTTVFQMLGVLKSLPGSSVHGGMSLSTRAVFPSPEVSP